MMMAANRETDPADRSAGGPGSHQRPDRPAAHGEMREPGTPTNSRRSRISGGGGERDSHHTHDPKSKS
jgi:hypothetical protein